MNIELRVTVKADEALDELHIEKLKRQLELVALAIIELKRQGLKANTQKLAEIFLGSVELSHADLMQANSEA